MKNAHSFAASLFALALAGCSGDVSDTSSQDSETTAVADTEASARDSGPDCRNLPRPDNRSDNDIIGIDVGMSADDALRIAQCSKEGYKVSVDYHDNNRLKLPDGSFPRAEIELRTETDRINIVVAGMPGQEEVFAILREKKFAAGEEPTLEQMRADLIAKYGEMEPVSNSIYTLAQSFTPDGQPIPGNELGGGGNCARGFGQNNNLGQVNGRCGFTKKIEVKSRYGNEALSGGFNVWLGNQNRMFVLIQQMYSTIAAMQQQQRDAAVEKAASSDRTPDL